MLIATYDGIFAFTNLNNLENFVKIDSNINSIIKYDKFYFHEQYGIKDIHVDNNKLYVSYIGERKDNCYDLKIIFSELNEKFLDFNLFYQTLNCVDKNNNHGFWAHQGAGGRIVNLDSSNLLFTTGDFRNRPLSQDIKSDFGKILKINIQNKNSEIVSMGHRNPQGLIIKGETILSTEHGPFGGDELNTVIEGRNYGWPTSAYGFTYGLENIYELDHAEEYEEPIYFFTPSIGISELTIYEGKEFPRWDNFILISSLKDMTMYTLKLDAEGKSIIHVGEMYIGERIRDITIANDGRLVLAGDLGSLIIVNRTDKDIP